MWLKPDFAIEYLDFLQMGTGFPLIVELKVQIISRDAL